MKKDIAFKELIKEIAKEIAEYLLEMKITDEIELIDKEFTRIEKREADLVFKHKDEIFHIEIQNKNDKLMHLRMMRYLNDIAFLYPENEINQYLIYIGKENFKMKNCYKNKNISYKYNVIDMKKIDCNRFLNLNTPEAVVLAILCDFKDKNKQEVVNEIIKRLYKLSKTKNEFLKHIEILSIFSTNRDLKEEVKRGVEMIAKIEKRKIPFYEDGFKEGEKRGLIKGKVLVYNELGFNIEEIAKKVNISKEKVEKILKENSGLFKSYRNCP